MRLVVAGGTGTVGRHVVETAQRAGHDVVALSRARGVDLLQGQGIGKHLAGADAVIDVTNHTTLSARSARRYFRTVTANLLREEERVGVGHHVALSIVGIDDIDASYYAGKLAQERLVAAGSVPYSIARVAQFHEFAGQLIASMKAPFVVMPRTLMRPVAAREVAAHLVSVAEAAPVGRCRDLVGPRDEVLADVARRLLASRGDRRRVFEVRFPGRYGAGLASGALRGSGDGIQTRLTYDDWLRDGGDREFGSAAPA